MSTCEIPPFCRNHYFTGKLLTERDFTAEQQYFRDKLRLHYRALHGWGVVCGLKVKPHPCCPDQRIVIEPGIAIDACGYEIVVPREVEIALPRPQKPPKKDPCPPDTPYEQEEYAPPKYDKRPDETPLAICLRFTECETEFSPAPFDECGCNGTNGQRPGRICESYVIEWRDVEPPRIDHCGDGDCEAIYQETMSRCPDPKPGGCVWLAFVSDYAPGDTITEAMIDNWTYRPLLPSTRTIDEILRCMLTRLPLGTLTRVRDLGWSHSQEYRCHDFIRFFTGDSTTGPSFEVSFDHPIRPDGLSPRTFQAQIVKRRGPHEGGRVEMPPTLVWASQDRTSVHLQIDRDYAQRELDGQYFEVFLSLRCNLILDEQGRAVDGDLIARLQDGHYVVAPPTGNGVAGGTLESWIRVRP